MGDFNSAGKHHREDMTELYDQFQKGEGEFAPKTPDDIDRDRRMRAYTPEQRTAAVALEQAADRTGVALTTYADAQRQLAFWREASKTAWEKVEQCQTEQQQAQLAFLTSLGVKVVG